METQCCLAKWRISAPSPELSANTLRRAHSDYARYANVKLRTSGHFWQNRYYSCPLDTIHQWTALAYVERNPVRAGIVNHAPDYAWSSAPTRLSDRDASEFLDLTPWHRSYSPEQWRDVLERGISEEAQLDFIQNVALQLGRALDRRKAGRPRKDTAD